MFYTLRLYKDSSIYGSKILKYEVKDPLSSTKLEQKRFITF